MFTSKYISELNEEFEQLTNEYYQNPDIDCAKNKVMELIERLNGSVAIRNERISGVKFAGESTRSDALNLVAMHDSGMIKSTMQKAIEANNFRYAFAISDLVEGSDKTFNDADKFYVRRLREEAEKLSGVKQEQIYLGESKVLDAKLNSFYNNVGTIDNDALSSKVNTDRAAVEIGVVYQRSKDEHIH